MARLIDAENYRNLFNEEFKKTMELIRKGETHLDTLAEGFTEADRVIRALPTIDPVTAAAEALGMSPDRLRELAQAEKEGRLVVLQNVKYTDSDGEKALRHAMYMCGVQNNPVTRYTADAIAEKLTREAAEAALNDLEAEHDR